MRNQNDNAVPGSGFSARAKRVDSLSARVLAHYRRQGEMVGFLLRAVRMAIGRVVAWHRRHTLSLELNGKPDYLLKDMGLTRWEIPAVVSGELGRKTLALSPTGGQSAPAFCSDEDENGQDDRDEVTPLAA